MPTSCRLKTEEVLSEFSQHLEFMKPLKLLLTFGPSLLLFAFTGPVSGNVVRVL